MPHDRFIIWLDHKEGPHPMSLAFEDGFFGDYDLGNDWQQGVE
jgi:hypothetical protein